MIDELAALAEANAQLDEIESTIATKWQHNQYAKERREYIQDVYAPIAAERRRIYNALQFYPTPPDVVLEMIAPYMVLHQHGQASLPKGWTICDPMAGEGDILEAINKLNGSRVDNRAIGLEIHPTSANKAAKFASWATVFRGDIMTWQPPMHVHLWVMNPPFRTGVKFLLRVWEIAAPGAEIVCILNADTIHKPDSPAHTELHKLIAQHGRLAEAGQPFKHSKRPCDVECVFVYLTKPAQANIADWDATEFDDADTILNTEPTTENTNTALAPLIHQAINGNHDAIAALVDNYNRAVIIIEERARLWSELQKIYKSVGIDSTSDTTAAVQATYWNYIFTATTIGRRATSTFRKEFQARQAEQVKMAFTTKNIHQLLLLFLNNQQAYIDQAVAQAFDELTGWNLANRWKTNRGTGLINPKVIVDWWSLWDKEFNSWRTYHDSKNICDKLDDLDKAIAMIRGVPYDNIVPASRVILNQCDYFNNNHEVDHRTARCRSTHFILQFYKKGTIHIWWRDLDVLDAFNLAAARAKKWLTDDQYNPWEADDKAAKAAKASRREAKKEQAWTRNSVPLPDLSRLALPEPTWAEPVWAEEQDIASGMQPALF